MSLETTIGAHLISNLSNVEVTCQTQQSITENTSEVRLNREWRNPDPSHVLTGLYQAHDRTHDDVHSQRQYRDEKDLSEIPLGHRRSGSLTDKHS